MPKPYHFQDGERCGLCYEEWPCAGRRNGLSGVQQWKLQTELVKSAEKAREAGERREALGQLIKEGLALLDLDIGIDFDRGYIANSYMIRIEHLAALVQKAIDNNDS